MEFSLGLENNALTVIPVNNKPMLAIANSEAVNDQGKALGFVNGDVLTKINGETMPDLGPDLGAFINKHQTGLAEGNTLSFGVLRKNDAGEQQEVELKATVKKVERKKRFVLSFNETATPEQLAVRQAWLKP